MLSLTVLYPRCLFNFFVFDESCLMLETLRLFIWVEYEGGGFGTFNNTFITLTSSKCDFSCYCK